MKLALEAAALLCAMTNGGCRRLVDGLATKWINREKRLTAPPEAV